MHDQQIRVINQQSRIYVFTGNLYELFDPHTYINSQCYLHSFSQLIITQVFQQSEKKIDVQQSQIEYRDNIGLKYGQNTETITFAISKSVDFILKTAHTIQMKGTIHTYWKEQNIYISSEYREGQNVRLVIYEDNYRIIEDRTFYIASGFKFTAEEGKVYTLRLIDGGNINKLIAMEISKSSSAFEKAATIAEYEQLSKKISAVGKQIKALFSITEFSDIMQQKNSVSANHALCLYMTYLMGQALIVVVIVFLQIRFMTRLLSDSTIV